MAEVGVPIPSPVYVVPHNVFMSYRASPASCMSRLAEELAVPARTAASRSKKKTLAVRRAYEVPGLANPGGPRFLGVAPDELASCIEKLFLFAIESGYDRPGAEVAVIFYPFVDPDNKPLDEIAPDEVLPYGGWVIPSSPESWGTTLKLAILATWGNNETLIRYGSEDRPLETYDVEVAQDADKRVRIPRKLIVFKEEMHYTARDGQSALVPVPPSHRLQQVMYDSEIVDVARYAASLMQRYGAHRLEFSSDGERILFNEAIEYAREPTPPAQELKIEGNVFVVAGMEDVRRLGKLTKSQRQELLIYATDRTEGSPTNNALAETFQGEELVVLYSGVTVTAHAMKVLSDMGHQAFAVGQRELFEGDRVRVTYERGHIRVENLTLAQLQEAVTLSSAHERGTSVVGGKAARLSYLQSLGSFSIPAGVVLTTVFYDKVLEWHGANRRLASLLASSPPGIEQLHRTMLEAIPSIPDPVWEGVKPLLERLGFLASDKRLIVRSSANVEDAKGRSFAGAFTSLPDVSGEEQIKQAVLRCIHSVFGLPVLGHLGEHLEQLLGIKLAVLLQLMVDARVSGTAFGGDPQTADHTVVLIEAKRGLPVEIVSGEEIEERLLFDKGSGRSMLREGSPILSEGEEILLVQMSKRLEEIFADPQDAEWAIDQQGKLWVLQCRDL